MQTVHPCIILGSYALDADRLPEDEFKIRLDQAREGMEQAGLDALLVYGDARDHGALAYLTNFIPRMRWALALLPLRGEPRLLCSVSSRDVPAMKTMTWIEDVYSGWEWKWFGDWVGRVRGDGASRFGAVGFDLMPAGLLGDIRRDLGETAEIVEAGHVLGRSLETRRPRELMLIRSAAQIVNECAAIFVRGQRDGKPFETAALEAEGHARRQAAQDVRTLVSFDGGRNLEPFRGEFDATGTSATCYIAIKYMGFWTDAFISVGADQTKAIPVSAALRSLIDETKPGVRFDALHSLAAGHLGSLELHPVIQGSFGHAIGLSPSVGPGIRAGETAEITAGAIYSLQVGTRDLDGGCLASALVLARPDGAEVLALSVPQ